jgi:hypothetical protein
LEVSQKAKFSFLLIPTRVPARLAAKFNRAFARQINRLRDRLSLVRAAARRIFDPFALGLERFDCLASGREPAGNFCWGGSMAIRRETFERLI